MARQEIILGTPPQGLGGDPPRTASMKINAMTVELYTALGAPAGTGSLPAALPVLKGGTGAATQAQACSNLGALRNQAANSTIGLSFGSAAPPNIASIDSSGNNANTALRISNIGNTSASAVMSFYRDGQFGVHFGIDTDNQLKLGGASYGANAYRIYHEGNTTRAADGTLKAI